MDGGQTTIISPSFFFPLIFRSSYSYNIMKTTHLSMQHQFLLFLSIRLGWIFFIFCENVEIFMIFSCGVILRL